MPTLSNSIHLTILNREQTIYDGEVLSVSSYNQKGEFDILGSHENFISLIKDKLIIRPVTGQPMQYPIEQGILHVLQNRIRVFLGIGR